jgi:type IV pilus assembly protein PilY1
VVALGVCSQAKAADPDIRDIPPFVMLVVDTSGSMEDLPACKCNSDSDCTNCIPNCSLLNTFGEPPKNSSGMELKKNRWAVTLEALTGKFVDFQCNELPRDAANGFAGLYDEGYTVKYHQPWKCASGTRCAYPGTTTQQKNGILDSYLETLQFGLMTFDGEYTYKGGIDLLDENGFNETLSTTMPGMWSYGGKKKFRYPGCSKEYYVDSGIRSSTATEGGLVSLSDTYGCASPPCDIYELNASIQDALIRSRPYGGTPIAASLDDLYWHLKNEVNDPYETCRKKYAILITDGAPDDDFRKLSCDCGDDNPMVPCTMGTPADFSCPYPLSWDAARNLVNGNPANGDTKGVIDKLFVLGMSVADSDAKQILDKVANYGNTTKALQADDPNTLRATLDSVFSPLLTPVSRSVPAFARGLTGVQYQVSSGFQVSATTLTSAVAPPWVGLIERRTFSCNPSTGALLSPDLEDKDRFQIVINAQDQTKRKLWTALPTATFTPASLTGVMARGSSELCGTDYCKYTELTDTAITQAILNVTTTGDRQNVIDWMRAESTSPRAGRRLGDIYHSSPALVGTPIDEPGDDAYTTFRDTPAVKERPLVMYIATNDGILHAISVEDYSASIIPLTVHPTQSWRAGEEIWGFVPPLLLGRLKDQLSSHQFNFDGTPVVKDVYFQRGTTAAETQYHSVLITGMRGGGNGYMALDVTDPFDKKFLWQFTDKDMGLTYAQPEIVQATFNWPPTSSGTPQTRAVAILSGGVGKKKSSSSTTANLPGCVLNHTFTPQKAGGVQYSSWQRDDAAIPKVGDHRKSVQCWERTGRALYFVDVETGILIKKVFDEDSDVSNGIFLPSPIVGTPAAFQDTVGTIASKGFVIDADGLIWRIDMSGLDPVQDNAAKGWTMRPFHDVFWDRSDSDGDGGETTYERPILSVDDQRRLVVLMGTGDTDNFQKPKADNRIVSLTEVSKEDAPDEPDDYEALINWEIRNEGDSGSGRGFYPTELVTGSMALFEGQLFAASFIANIGSSDACDPGRGRLWSLSYNEPDTGHKNTKNSLAAVNNDPLTYGPKRIDVEGTTTDDSDNELFNIDKAKALKNLLIQGVGTTQRISCAPPETSPLNSYFAPSLASITQNTPPAIWVVAQASGGTQRANSRLGSVQSKIIRPLSFSRVTSWATSVD